MREVFEDLKGYEESYQISDFGRIFTKRRLVGNQIYYGRELVPQLTNDGYLKVTLCKNGESKKFYLHRLVALQFIDNNTNLPQVNHKDGNKLNNTVTNLEWCTKIENQNHAVRTGLMQRGQDRPSAKLTEEQVLEIYKLKGILKSQDIANKYNVSKNTINCILRGSKWSYLYKQYFKNETIQKIRQSAAKSQVVLREVQRL